MRAVPRGQLHADRPDTLGHVFLFFWDADVRSILITLVLLHFAKVLFFPAEQRPAVGREIYLSNVVLEDMWIVVSYTVYANCDTNTYAY